MVYDFDDEHFANLIAERIKQGYRLQYAILLALTQYPPLVDAILKGVEKGGK